MTQLIQKPNKQEIEKLLKKRHDFIAIGGEISRLIAPKIFELQRENINNLRNIVIISGALATFGLLVLGNSVIGTGLIYLKISIISFLLTIIFSSFYLNKSVSKTISSYNSKLEENMETSKRAQNIINDRIDGKITKFEASKKLFEVYKKIEYEHIRPKEKDDKKRKEYIYDLISILFIVSIAAAIFYFAHDIVSSFLSRLFL